MEGFAHLKGQMVYLACPYTHADASVRHDRFLKVCAASAWLIKTHKLNVIAAIIQSHHLVVHHDFGAEWEYWEDYDTTLIGMCAELWVLRIDGWDTSEGIRAEMRIAEEQGKPICFLVPSTGGNYIIAGKIHESHATSS